ncbi:hypothetical protein MXB_1638 [Myxobolus squamalis]|nr:hypothetical protein MXB_1638 [Myxobolus squamalis]
MNEIFINAIFQITSAPFYQCLIVMGHDLTVIIMF